MTTILLLLVVALVAFGGLGLWSYLICDGFEMRFEREGRDVEVDGGVINVLELGDPGAEGPPVVLVHGSGTNLKDLKVSLGERLARERRVILIDRPGHGWSTRVQREGIHTPEVQAIVLNDVLTSIGVVRPLIVGHDWGGALALSYALGYPEEVGAVVAIAPVSHPSPRGVPVLYRIAATGHVGRLLCRFAVPALGRIWIESGLRRAFSPARVPADYPEAVGFPLLLRPTNFRANAQDIVGLDAYLEDQSVYYGQIGTRLVVIVGDEDAVAPPRIHGERLAGDVAGARMVLLSEAGHMPHHSSPNVIAFEVNRLAESLR